MWVAEKFSVGLNPCTFRLFSKRDLRIDRAYISQNKYVDQKSLWETSPVKNSARVQTKPADCIEGNWQFNLDDLGRRE